MSGNRTISEVKIVMHVALSAFGLDDVYVT